jgi:hypothetical protein
VMKTMMGGADGGAGAGALADMMKGLGDMENMDLATIMQQGMGMWKDMLSSPEMQAMMSDPDQMRQLMSPFVEMMGGDKEKLEEVLADPETLKKSMTEGLDAMTDLMSDPAKLQEMANGMLEALDPALKEKVQKLASGDTEALSEVIAEIDPSGQMAELMKDPSKLTDPAYLTQLQEQLGITGDLGDMTMDQLMQQIAAKNVDQAANLAGSGLNLGSLDGAGIGA